jgi:predicted MFS family arabinose efflux permease
MTQTIKKFINDSAAARWTALILIASMMLFAYMFVDVMAPIQSYAETQLDWNPTIYGNYASSEYLLNICGFLILAGFILDKTGIRFTGLLSGSLMVIGATIKFIGISEWFQGTGFCEWLNSWWTAMPGSAKMASLGFMIFGCGCEMAGTTVSKAIAKWFKGKEMAMAMGVEMAIARVGVFAIFSLSPVIRESFGDVTIPVAFCLALLVIGLLNYMVFSIMDKKLDKQMNEAGISCNEENEEEFKFSDVKSILTSKSFWVVAILCVLYYSAIFPFQKYGANMLQCNLGISATAASNIFRWFPIGAAIITPFLGRFLDKKGKGATMLLYGSLLLIVCHLVFAFVVPATQSAFIAYTTIVILGISFALVPAALWPSVPKIIEEKLLGSAYSLIFWVQNIGLFFVPMLIGSVLASVNEDNVAVKMAQNEIEIIKEIKTDVKNLDHDLTLEDVELLTAKADSLYAAAQIDSTQVAPIKSMIKENTNRDDLYVKMTDKADSVLVPYNYTVPLVIFACFGIAALLVAIYLKIYDKKRNLGLEEPNIKE